VLDIDAVLEKIKYRKTRWTRKQRTEGTLRMYRSIFRRYNALPMPENATELDRVKKFI